MATSSRVLSLTIAAALFMENMDQSIIATSLPSIARDLGTDPVSLKLAFTTYLLSLTVFLPISGWLADRFGARRVFVTAVGVFTGASMLCGYANSLHWLVGARALQGLGGALMVPVGRIILLRAVPKAELVDALAWLTLPALAGPLIGPPIGGFITTYFDWRWVFWMNLPFGILGVLLALKLMPQAQDHEAGSLDVPGFLLSALGLSLSVFGLTVIGRGILPDLLVYSLIGIGLLLLVTYVIYARRTADPVLDLRLFNEQTFRVGVLGGSLYRLGVGAIPFLFPLMLQIAFGYDAFQSGLITCSSALGAMAMKLVAGPLIRRTGFRTLLVANGILSCVMMIMNGFVTVATPTGLLVSFLFGAAFTRSLQFTAMNAMSYADIHAPDMSKATALYTVVQQLSLALGVALAALVLETSQAVDGRTSLVTVDFSRAFIVVGVVALVSVAFFWRLSRDAGTSVSGRNVNGP